MKFNILVLSMFFSTQFWNYSKSETCSTFIQSSILSNKVIFFNLTTKLSEFIRGQESCRVWGDKSNWKTTNTLLWIGDYFHRDKSGCCLIYQLLSSSIAYIFSLDFVFNCQLFYMSATKLYYIISCNFTDRPNNVI